MREDEVMCTQGSVVRACCTLRVAIQLGCADDGCWVR